MAFQMIPVKNQKFEVGRTINLSKCDCKECTYMNCPKQNYAVRMTKKIWKVTDFWEEFKKEILAINKPCKWEYNFHSEYCLELNYKLITEFVDMLFRFPKGVYWSPEDSKWHTDDTEIEGQIYKIIALQKVSRKGNIVTLGRISIRNGNYTDYDLSATQEKFAIRISKVLKELKELIFEYYQNQDKDWVIGWLSPEGRHYPCRNTEHSHLAIKLGGGEILLESKGWVKIALDDTYFFTGRNMTAEQKNWLSINGFELED